MAKKGCIVRIYPGGFLGAGKKELYVISGTDGRVQDVIATSPSDSGPVIAAGYDPHDAVELEVTKATYKRYLAHAKKSNPASSRGKMPAAELPPPIPGMEGPFSYKTGFVLYWDPKEGQYYDRGKDLYLSIEEVESAMGTKNPTRTARKKAKKKSARPSKAKVSAVMRNALRGT